MSDPLRDAYSVTTTVLGRGTYGRVLLATHRETRTMHALKYTQYCPEIQDSPSHIAGDASDDRERVILQQLSHENVVKLLQAFMPYLPKRPQLVLAFRAADTDLAAFLCKRHGALRKPLTSAVAGQLARGLAYVHSQGIVHRDVKPANVLIFIGDDTPLLNLLVQLADFGMARKRSLQPQRLRGKQLVAADNLPVTMRLPMTARVCTSWYRAPELLFLPADVGEVSYSSAIDVWSFGCVLYEILSGHPLCAGDGPLDILGILMGVLGAPPALPWQAQPMLDKLLKQGAVESRPLPVSPDVWWEVVALTLQWDEVQRPSIQSMVSRYEWLRPPTLAASQGQSTASLSSTLATSQGPVTASTASIASTASEPTTTTPSGEEGVHPANQQDLLSLLLGAARVTDSRPVHKSTETCGCTGHCYQPGHRYWGGCFSHEVLVGSTRCLECACVVCLRPRYLGDLCSTHRRAVSQLPSALQVVRASRSVLSSLVPVDVSDFLTQYPFVRHDAALTVLVAFIKEPLAVNCFLEALGGPRHICANKSTPSSAELYGALEAMARRLDHAPHRTELQQLNRQGVGRFTGAATTCRFLQVIATHEESPEVHLGLTGRAYMFTNNLQGLEAFVIQARSSHIAEQGDLSAPGVLEQRVQDLRAIVIELGTKVPGMGTKSPGYVCNWLVRKIMMADLLHQSIPVNWSSVSLTTVRAMCPDQSDVLSTIPTDWSADFLSQILFGRRNWALMASLFGCLWQERGCLCLLPHLDGSLVEWRRRHTECFIRLSASP